MRPGTFRYTKFYTINGEKAKIANEIFQQIIYEADIEIKALLYKFLQKLEDILREKIKKVIGNDFLNPELFQAKYREKRINFIKKKLTFLKQKGIKHLNAKNFFNNLSFGELIYYFQDLKANYKDKINEGTFKFLKANILLDWLKNMKFLRNLICHNENILNRDFEENIGSNFANWYLKKNFGFKTNKNNTFWHYLAVVETFDKTLNLNSNISQKIIEILQNKKKATCRSDHHVPEIFIPDTEGWQVFLNSLYSKYIRNQEKDKKINIIQFLPYYPPHKGGLETHAQEWAENWIKKGYGKVINITTNIGTQYEGKNKIFKEEENGITTYYLPSIEIVWNFPVYKFWKKEVRKLLKDLAKQDSLIITRTRFFLTSLIGGIFATKNKKKWIHIEHGSGYVKLSSKMKTFIAWVYDKIFGKWIFKKTDLVIPISNACKNFTLELGGKNIKLGPVIYRGFGFWKKSEEILKKSEEIEKIKEWKKEGKIILGFVGRIYKWKGVENIIKGLQKIKKGEIGRKFGRNLKKKIKLVIVGDGEDLEYLKNLVKDFGLGDIVYFTGGKPFKEALAIQSLFDIHIHSSLPGGGLSGTLVQGMWFAPVVVSSQNEGAKEILKRERSEESSEEVRRENKGIAILIGEKENYSIEDMKNDILKGIEVFEKGEDFRKINRPFIEKAFDWDKNIEKYYLEFKKL